MRNRYRGNCEECGIDVEAEEGHVFRNGNQWLTRCDDCEDSAEKIVRVTLSGDTALVKPEDFLGTDLFRAYREACADAGSVYSKALQGNRVPLDGMPRLIKGLKAAGMVVSVDDKVANALAAEARKAQSTAGATDNRLDAVQAKLAERGQALYGYQVNGVKWLSQRTGALLDDEMGLGKTVQALVALPENAPVVVVCPAIAKGVWERETAKWRPEFSTQILRGRNSFRWAEPGEIVITNYDILPTGSLSKPPPGVVVVDDDSSLNETIQAIPKIPVAEEGKPKPKRASILVMAPESWATDILEARPGYNVVTVKGRKSFRWPKAGQIVITDVLPVDKPAPGTVMIGDEFHAVKNNKSKRTKSWRALKDAAVKSGGKAWGLTGSPLLNRPPELWALLTAVDCHREAFGGWDRFKIAFGGKEGRFGIEWSTHVAPAAAKMLKRVSLRRERIDVLPDLPTKTYRDLSVDNLNAATRRACGAALEALESAGINLDAAVNEANFFANRGPAFEEMSAARQALATAKIPHMLALISEFEAVDEPLVIFSAHRAPIDALAQRDGWAVITGDTPDAKRTEIEDAFQAGKLKGIGGTIQAMGTALTLTRAHEMVFVDQAWVPDLNAQAEDRCCRIGQDRGVIVTRLVADHRLDEMVTATLVGKQQLVAESVHASRRQTDEIDDRAAALAEAASALTSDVETGDAADVRRQTSEAQRAAQSEISGPSNGRRSAIHPAEDWAAAALAKMAGRLDPDDAPLGDRLTGDLAAGRGLTDAQWDAARTIAKRYWSQVGACPDENQAPF